MGDLEKGEETSTSQKGGTRKLRIVPGASLQKEK